MHLMLFFKKKLNILRTFFLLDQIIFLLVIMKQTMTMNAAFLKPPLLLFCCFCKDLLDVVWKQKSFEL